MKIDAVGVSGWVILLLYAEMIVRCGGPIRAAENLHNKLAIVERTTSAYVHTLRCSS